MKNFSGSEPSRPSRSAMSTHLTKMASGCSCTRAKRLRRTRNPGSPLYGCSPAPGRDKATRRTSSSLTISGCYPRPAAHRGLRGPDDICSADAGVVGQRGPGRPTGGGAADHRAGRCGVPRRGAVREDPRPAPYPRVGRGVRPGRPGGRRMTAEYLDRLAELDAMVARAQPGPDILVERAAGLLAGRVGGRVSEAHGYLVQVGAERGRDPHELAAEPPRALAGPGPPPEL